MSNESQSRSDTDVLAWHVTDECQRDGKPLSAIGVEQRYDAAIVPYKTGLYASRRLLDALPYGTGSVVTQVSVASIEQEWEDKLVCRSRTALWRVDAEQAFRTFARQCAWECAGLAKLSAAAIEFLRNGGDSLAARDEARDCARTFDWNMQEDAAYFAARDAVFYASWEGAIDADGYQARVAARDASAYAAFAIARHAASKGLDGYTIWKRTREQQAARLESLCASQPRIYAAPVSERGQPTNPQYAARYEFLRNNYSRWIIEICCGTFRGQTIEEAEGRMDKTIGALESNERPESP